MMLSFVFYATAGKEIKKIVKPLGFKKYGRVFYRITDDGVVQQFCILCLHSKFTILSDARKSSILAGSKEFCSEKSSEKLREK